MTSYLAAATTPNGQRHHPVPNEVRIASSSREIPRAQTRFTIGITSTPCLDWAMNANMWAANPFAIHVGVNSARNQLLEEEARYAGASVLELKLAGVRDRHDLCERLAQTFMFPHECAGLDAALDLISDLEWFGNDDGYLLVVDAEGAPDAVITDLTGVLPAIVDRWRSQRQPFVVALTNAGNRVILYRLLEHANAALDSAGHLPWAQPGTGTVPIVVHEPEPTD